MEKEQENYDFQIVHRGARCSCTCPCSTSNPVDVTVVFTAEREKKMVTISPESFKKLG